jgi:hypothetical protein
VVRVLGYKSVGLGSIPGTTRKKSSGVWNGVHSVSLSTTEELLDRKVAVPVQKIENTAVGIRHADYVAPSVRKSWQSLLRHAAVSRCSSLADPDHGLALVLEAKTTYINRKLEKIHHICRGNNIVCFCLVSRSAAETGEIL